jgi:hypothetical protein
VPENVGPEPYAIPGSLGVIGAVIKVSQPEWKKWAARVDECVKRKTAALDRHAEPRTGRPKAAAKRLP